MGRHHDHDSQPYRLYLQGREYQRRPGDPRHDFEIAQDFYERAVALDSTFALAHAALSALHGWVSWFRYDPSPARLVRQREEGEIAVRLAPSLPLGRFAAGLVHYVGRWDWQAALKEYRIALAGLPTDAGLWRQIGNVHRRLGNWEEALAWAQARNAESFLGHADWRLPEAKELQGIVDYTRAPDSTNSPAIDPLFEQQGYSKKNEAFSRQSDKDNGRTG